MHFVHQFNEADRNDWVKKSIFSFIVILFMIGITLGVLGVMEANAMLAEVDALTLIIITIIPVVLGIAIVYGIWKADFLT